MGLQLRRSPVLSGKLLNEGDAGRSVRNQLFDLYRREMQRDCGSGDQVRCAMRRPAHDAVRLVGIFAVGVTMSQRGGRNRQEGHGRHNDDGLAEKAAHKRKRRRA